jgi:hypothetical protein
VCPETSRRYFYIAVRYHIEDRGIIKLKSTDMRSITGAAPMKELAVSLARGVCTTVAATQNDLAHKMNMSLRPRTEESD